jgi:hypothetical protein
LTLDLSILHRRRLLEVWRSAGWPFLDTTEAELLAGGWLERRWDAEQRVTVHLTDKGMQAIVDTARTNRQRLSRHEALVDRVARLMHDAGRVVWCGLPLRARLPTPPSEGEASPSETGPSLRWVMAIPDVFSIRHTTKPEYLEPTAHEIKVNRADLLSDLRNADKAAAYRQAAGQCWYVIREGIGEPEEIPTEFGVIVARTADLITARPAPRLHHALPFATWMTLARAAPIRFEPQTQSLRVEPSAFDRDVNPLCETSVRSSMRSGNADS